MQPPLGQQPAIGRPLQQLEPAPMHGPTLLRVELIGRLPQQMVGQLDTGGDVRAELVQIARDPLAFGGLLGQLAGGLDVLLQFRRQLGGRAGGRRSRIGPIAAGRLGPRGTGGTDHGDQT